MSRKAKVILIALAVVIIAVAVVASTLTKREAPAAKKPAAPP